MYMEKFKVQGSRFKVQGIRDKAAGIGIGVFTVFVPTSNIEK
jgi:hypothetical protein